MMSSQPLTQKWTTSRSSTKRVCAAIESTPSQHVESVQPVGAGLAPWNCVQFAADLVQNGASAYTTERAAQAAQSPHKTRWVQCRPPEMESARFVWIPSRCTSSRFAATSFAHIAAGRPPTRTATSMRVFGAAFADKRTWPGQARHVDGDSDDFCNDTAGQAKDVFIKF